MGHDQVAMAQAPRAGCLPARRERSRALVKSRQLGAMNYQRMRLGEVSGC